MPETDRIVAETQVAACAPFYAAGSEAEALFFNPT
jgi:hypothetical protein